jgi:hypothetical protein
MKNENEIFQAIEIACEGLIYISETDAPIIPFIDGTTADIKTEIIRQHVGAAADVPIEERNFTEFFDRLTSIKDWYGKKEIARAKKFFELKTLLEENLCDLKVFRIGSRSIDIFVLGTGANGTLMGVTTKAVET